MKIPLAVEAEGKTISPNLKQAAADGKKKLPDQAKTSLSLPIPESTPGPDTARIKANKARRQAEAAKAPL